MKIRRFLILRKGQLWKNFRGWIGWDEETEGGRTTAVYLQQSLTSVQAAKQMMCQDAAAGEFFPVLRGGCICSIAMFTRQQQGQGSPPTILITNF